MRKILMFLCNISWECVFIKCAVITNLNHLEVQSIQWYWVLHRISFVTGNSACCNNLLVQRIRCSTLSFSVWDFWVLRHSTSVGSSVKNIFAAVEDYSVAFSRQNLFLCVLDCLFCITVELSERDWYQSYVEWISVCHPECCDIIKYAMTVLILDVFLNSSWTVVSISAILFSVLSSRWPILLLLILPVTFMHYKRIYARKTVKNRE